MTGKLYQDKFWHVHQSNRDFNFKGRILESVETGMQNDLMAYAEVKLHTESPIRRLSGHRSENKNLIREVAIQIKREREMGKDTMTSVTMESFYTTSIGRSLRSMGFEDARDSHYTGKEVRKQKITRAEGNRAFSDMNSAF